MSHSLSAAPASDRTDARALAVTLNGEHRTTRAQTLAALIEEAGYGTARIATAVNGVFVAQRARAATMLTDGDAIEIVAPRQGG